MLRWEHCNIPVCTINLTNIGHKHLTLEYTHVLDIAPCCCHVTVSSYPYLKLIDQ